MELTPEEGRVLGALVEKERTTPQAYPLTDNALVAACNQTTSRDPVVSYDVPTVRLAVRSLREQGLLRTVHRSGERSDKHRHELESALGLSPAQVAVLALLLLRGPQTAAELRARAERLQGFASVEDVEQVLGELAARDEPLAVRLEREPGRREARWAQLLTGETAGPSQVRPGGQPGERHAPPSQHDAPWAQHDAPSAQHDAPSAQQDAPSAQHDAPSAQHDPPRAQQDALLAEHLAELAGEVTRLRAEVARLRTELDELQQRLP